MSMSIELPMPMPVDTDANARGYVGRRRRDSQLDSVDIYVRRNISLGNSGISAIRGMRPRECIDSIEIWSRTPKVRVKTAYHQPLMSSVLLGSAKYKQCPSFSAFPIW